jgi:hypothetical protein
LHGLLDWQLGIEMLATMSSNAYHPGMDGAVTGRDGRPVRMPAWRDLAEEVALRYREAFTKASAPLPSPGPLPGWSEPGGAGVVSLVVHPLCDEQDGEKNVLAECKQWAASQGIAWIRLVDSFNLSRRMAWVRANLDQFRTVDVAGSGTAELFAGAGAPVPGSPGGSLEHGGRRYECVDAMPVASAGPGEWLARYSDGRFLQLVVRRAPGAAAPMVVVPGRGRIGEAEAKALEVFARCRAVDEGGR